MAFELVLHERVHIEIDEAFEYYFSKSEKVAGKFYYSLQTAHDALSLNPFYEVRYLDYRCLPNIGFPYMFHFTISGNTVYIHALINTYRNPEKYWLS